MRWSRCLPALAAACLLWGSGAIPTAAGDVQNDPEAIVRALQPPPAGPSAPATRSFRPANARGIAIEGGDVSEEAPSIDLYVHFEYDQSNLTLSDARLVLDALGKALRDPRLAGMSFEIIGHTDARGSDDYNLTLSRRRAEAVRAYLIQFHQVDAGHLKAEGRGKRELKDPARPEDGVNRRVQVRTVALAAPSPAAPSRP